MYSYVKLSVVKPPSECQIWPNAFSVNKVLLKHSHAHLFEFSLCCFNTKMAHMGIYNTDGKAHKVWTAYCWDSIRQK